MTVQISGKELHSFEKSLTVGSVVLARISGCDNDYTGTITRINAKSFAITCDDGDKINLPRFGERTYSFNNCVLPSEVAEVTQDAYEQALHGLALFAQAVYQYINQHVLEPDDMVIRPLCGHPYLTKLTLGMGKAEILDLTNYVCPACAQEIAEFEWACEAEYQASKGVRV